jgi:outer membrane protein TolC
VPRRSHRALVSRAAAFVSLAAGLVPLALAHAQVPTAPTAPTATATASAAASPAASPSTKPAPTSAAAVASTTTLDEAQSPNASANVYGLGRCIALADASSPQIRQAQDRLEQARAQLDEAKWAPWMQFSLSGGLAVVPEVRGTAVYSPNTSISLSSGLAGTAGRVSIDGVIPLWTFGKISSIKRVAEGQAAVAAIDVERFKIMVHHDVRRAWFGVMLAHDARYLLDQAGRKLDDAIAKADERDDVDEVDLLRMKTYRAEIKARLGEIEKYERIGMAALRFFTGVAAPATFAVPDEPIAAPRKPLVDELVYLAAARIHRPEIRQVREGVKAREAQVDYAKARLYPDVGIGLSFSYANSPVIADQTNPFVVDGANYLPSYGVGVVFRWNLDFLPGSARVRYAEWQLAETRDLEQYALGGVGVEVSTAYATARDALVREQAYGEAETLSKRWVSTVSAAMSVGTREEREIIDPLRAYLTNRYNHLQAIMDLDLAYSQLALSTGDESIAEY